MIYEYQGGLYPDFLKEGNAAQFILPVAKHFCRGNGLDVGCGKWPIPGAVPIELTDGQSAYALPPGEFDYIFSSHCLEHLEDPVLAIEHWKARLAPGASLFLYLPHPDMRYWRPENCRKHRHLFWPQDVCEMLKALGFVNVIHSQRDMAWSFAIVGFMPHG